MTRAGVVVNPTAGGGRAGVLWHRLEPLARSLGATEVQRPTGRTETVASVRRMLDAGVDRVVVVGGDGTIHLAVNELMRAASESRPGLGVVPAGTGSDLARALGLPRHPEEALRRALLGPLRRLDVGQVEGEGGRFFFANIASAGIGGLVDSMVNEMPRRGRTAFLRATLVALLRYHPVALRVAVDGEPWYEGRAFLLAVANGTSFGKGMRATPNARMDDGLFDVLLVKPLSRLQLVLRLPQVYLGRHLRARPVMLRRGRKVGVVPLGPMPPLDADGENYPATTCELTVLPAALGFANAGGEIDA